MRSLPRLAIAFAGVVALAVSLPLAAQGAPHLITVKLADVAGGQFAFQPAAISAQRGDTVRFVQASSAPHDVDFKKMPKGAKLGSESVGPYMMTPGQTYDLVIDGRFVDGAYDFVCDPHESVGMHGTLTVGTPSK
jgi:plastocyanin